MLSDLPKDIQLGHDEAKIWIQSVWFQSLGSYLTFYMILTNQIPEGITKWNMEPVVAF